MLLSNLFNNRFNEFINNNNKENIINHRLNKNITNLWLPAIEKDRVADQSEIKKRLQREIELPVTLKYKKKYKMQVEIYLILVFSIKE